MKEECKSAIATCKTEWTVFHKESANGQQVEIIVGGGEKLEIGIMRIPMSKATPETVEVLERKISEAFQLLQNKSNCDQEDQMELRVGLNDVTGAQEVYLTGKNGEHQLVVSSADYEE